MDERERIRQEMDAADAIRAGSEGRIASLGDAIRSDIYDKLIHQAWFGQIPGQYADDLTRYADQTQDAALPTADAPQAEASMEALYGKAAPQAEKQPEPPQREIEIER